VILDINFQDAQYSFSDIYSSSDFSEEESPFGIVSPTINSLNLQRLLCNLIYLSV